MQVIFVLILVWYICTAKKPSLRRQKGKEIYSNLFLSYEKKSKDHLVEFSVDPVWAKLFQKVFEVQSVDGHDLCAPPLPFISGRNKQSTGVTINHYKSKKAAPNSKKTKQKNIYHHPSESYDRKY